MTTENQQISDLIASGAASGSISTGGTWGDAPRISTSQKVTAPSKIRASHDSDELIEIAPVKGPSKASLDDASRRDAERRRKELEEADARAAALAEATPEKVLARLAWAERAITKLQKRINQLEKQNNA